MDNILKCILLYAVFILSLFGLFHTIDDWYSKNVEIQQNILIKQAQTHFNNQINTRKWNSKYGGIFVKQFEGQEPNPYLKDNTLKVNDDLTLIKINPALMTRELSELSDIEDFSFRITSLTPINPNNKASEFEIRALKNFDKTKDTEYYEFKDSDKFRYMGALITTESCLTCHKHENYKLGEIEGGISVTLSRNEYNDIIKSLTDKVKIAKVSLFLFLSIITLLIHKQFNNNINLLKKVKSRTKEIEETKKLLQKILDADKSFLLVSDGTNIIFANKTALDLAGFSSLADFEDKHKHISDKFEKVANPDFLQSDNKGLHWIDYMRKEQNNRELKVLIKKDGENKYFKPHSKEINIDNKLLYLITFDDITDDYIKIKDLTTEASTDPLTGLFNRRKLDSVLNTEMELSSATNSPLSIIFLDIDHFKIVNDTFGHDVGDEVLVDLSRIIHKTVRQGDFIARWGGEEFMIALQATNYIQASALAKIIRVAVEKYSFNIVEKIT
ncbi:MAG: diguanylate cyclase, partial [Sulfurimonas sp.]|nr:diguanylate cyclase [Sulfurimonas sp.]